MWQEPFDLSIHHVDIVSTITVTSRECHEGSNHRQLDCLFNTLLRIMTGIIKHAHYWPFMRGIHQSPVDSPHKWPVMQKALPCHDVIIITIIVMTHLQPWSPPAPLWGTRRSRRSVPPGTGTWTLPWGKPSLQSRHPRSTRTPWVASSYWKQGCLLVSL